MKDAFCSFCGHSFGEARYPKVCVSCGKWTHKQPRPVAVVLVPVRDSLLVVRRAFEPQAGLLNLPGGHIEHEENWDAAAARELGEETGLVVEPSELQLYDVKSTSTGYLVFFSLAPLRFDDLDVTTLKSDVEVTEITLIKSIDETSQLAFDTHNEVARTYFSARFAPFSPIFSRHRLIRSFLGL